MAKIIDFPLDGPNYRRARGKRPWVNPQQLDLFAHGKVVDLPTSLSPFELALLYDEHDDPRAEQAYLRAIQAGDNTADACCNIGALYADSGRPHEAYDYLGRAVVLDPQHMAAHLNLGSLYLGDNDLNLAALHFERCCKLDPTNHNVYYHLGLVRARQGNLADAIIALEQCRALAKRRNRTVDELLESLRQALRAERA